jgi:hypothetical protein
MLMAIGTGIKKSHGQDLANGAMASAAVVRAVCRTIKTLWRPAHDRTSLFLFRLRQAATMSAQADTLMAVFGYTRTPSVHEQLIEALKAKGWTYADIARRSGVSEHKLRAGIMSHGQEALLHLVAFTLAGIDVDDLPEPGYSRDS